MTNKAVFQTMNTVMCEYMFIVGDVAVGWNVKWEVYYAVDWIVGRAVSETVYWAVKKDAADETVHQINPTCWNTWSGL